MSAWELAAVAGGAAGALVVTLVVTVLLARLVAAVANLDRGTRELGRVIEELRAEALLRGSDGAGVRSNGDAEQVEQGPSPARRGNGRARLPDLALVTPVIKARALGRGTSLAAREFRQRRER